MSVIYVDFNAYFFTKTFQPMNVPLTFQIGLNDFASVIPGKFTFAADLESFQLNRMDVNNLSVVL